MRKAVQEPLIKCAENGRRTSENIGNLNKIGRTKMRVSVNNAV